MAHPPWKGNCPLLQERVQTPQWFLIYPVAQMHCPLEMIWLAPQVKQFPLESRSSSSLHWLTHIDPSCTFPWGHPHDLPLITIMLLGQTEQNPWMRKPLGIWLQTVQTLAELWAYPCLQTQRPLDNSSLGPQLEQLEPSAEGWVPWGQTVQMPLILPRPLRQVHLWVLGSISSLVPHFLAQIPYWLVK